MHDSTARKAVIVRHSPDTVVIPGICRRGCGACCIAPSITTPMPGLPGGKPAGMPCPHLTGSFDCGLWGDPRRPAVCDSLKPEPEMCGDSREHALTYLATLEHETRTGSPT